MNDGQFHNDGKFHFFGCIPDEDVDGCSCGTEYHFRYSQDGVLTPGCDCGHEGMGWKWHFNCVWREEASAQHTT